ncbi:MAG: putative sugar O-methyltransferase [Candidatus Omnitrophica bacterium]|nr:putative sugar O-methyltransferase [Candidatus Omnitrophota bacterium]
MSTQGITAWLDRATRNLALARARAAQWVAFYRHYTTNTAKLDALKQGCESRQPQPAPQPDLLARLVESYLVETSLQPRDAGDAYAICAELKEVIHRYWEPYLSAIERRDAQGLQQLFNSFFRNGGATYFGIGDFNSTHGRLGLQDGNRLLKMSYINRVLQHLEVWSSLTGERQYDRLGIPSIGNPFGYLHDGQVILSVAPRVHYYSVTTAQLLAHRQRRVVAEIGGGFGLYAYYLLRDEANTTYVGFDLPESLLMAKYFLLNSLPGKSCFFLEEGCLDALDYDALLHAYDVILLPHYLLPRWPEQSVDLCLNSASLGEMPSGSVNEYLRHIDRITRTYFLHENYRQRVKGYWTGDNGFVDNDYIHAVLTTHSAFELMTREQHWDETLEARLYRKPELSRVPAEVGG